MASPIRSVHESLWVIDHPSGRKMPLEGGRTALIKLRGGGLWVHSPGPLTHTLRAEIEKLGAPVALVAPNSMHHQYCAENQTAFPAAKLFVAPALPAKEKELRFDEVLGDQPPPLWRDELDQVVVQGMPKLTEVVFFHRASRSLILTDIAFNIRHSKSWLTRQIMRLNGGYDRFGPSRIMRMMVKDKAALRGSLDQILAWDFDRIVLPHGEIMERGGKEAFRAAFEWA